MLWARGLKLYFPILWESRQELELVLPGLQATGVSMVIAKEQLLCCQSKGVL